MTVEEVAARAADIIEELGLGRGDMVVDGHPCARGAINIAAHGDVWSGSPLSEEVARLAADIAGCSVRGLENWSDHASVAEVVAALRAVAVGDPAHVRVLEG